MTLGWPATKASNAPPSPPVTPRPYDPKVQVQEGRGGACGKGPRARLRGCPQHSAWTCLRRPEAEAKGGAGVEATFLPGGPAQGPCP